MRHAGSAAWLALAAALPACAADPPMARFFAEGKVRALILSGRNNHDWRTTTPFLRKALEASGRFDTRVAEEPAGLTAESLAPYDVLVLDYCGPRWGATAERAVEEFVRGGKGLVAVHAASYPFGNMEVLGGNQTRTSLREPPWPEYARMVGASWGQAPNSGHGRRHVFTVKWQDRAHPVAAGMADFPISDELYHNLHFEPGVKVVAAAYDDPKMLGTGKEEPLLWTVAYGKGRVFHTALGHDVEAMMAPGFVASFARGAEWAASGTVTLPAEIPLERRAANPVRALVVVGGHDHDGSFYAVLEGQPDLAANVDPHPVALRGDLRKRYDVIVFYDMIPDVSEDQKKNLVEFAESGKGLVMVHHAIADFPAWDWWRDLLGGKYLLKPEGGRPGSTYKHDVELTAVPAADHPVMKGVPPMRLVDETYKGMWISPEAKVLMTTNEATSDGPLVWISPYAKSRVVYVQLGHGRTSHVHPGFQRLVRNAVLWAAGRQ